MAQKRIQHQGDACRSQSTVFSSDVEEDQLYEQEKLQNQQQHTSDQQSTRTLEDLDDVLDDIESTLLTHAQEYVESYVQKGGE